MQDGWMDGWIDNRMDGGREMMNGWSRSCRLMQSAVRVKEKSVRLRLNQESDDMALTASPVN